ncbi:MAG: lipoprotein [Planctomycetota bacterium]|nr:MAG: lipoprotein [Planctomycetota bacterium]
MRPLVITLALALGAVSCASSEPYDYNAFLDHMPRSILVLPPLDESPEVSAGQVYLSTVTPPLSEVGYYVFPVALVDRILRENGLPTAVEMHAISLSKLSEVFDPDAVLYTTIHKWGTEYQVINSTTQVVYSARLVDARTGRTIWSGRGSAVQSSGDGGGGFLGALVGAVVNQVATTVSDPTPDVAHAAHQRLFFNKRNGLLLGPYHPKYEDDQRKRREEAAAQGPQP